MFEEVVSDAVHMLLLLFWDAIAFMMILGTLWIRSSKRAQTWLEVNL